MDQSSKEIDHIRYQYLILKYRAQSHILEAEEAGSNISGMGG